MNKYYPYLSEIMRTNYWSMHAGFLEYYRSEIEKAVNSKNFDTSRLEESKSKPRLLVFHAGQLDPEERLILTGHANWYDEEWLKKDDQIINVVPLEGPIISGGGPCTSGTAELADRFVYADARSRVVGHLVILNTEGGSAVANELNDLFENSKKPVVALIRGMNCSKGVEISSHIPHVFAEHENAEIGCIGVMANIRGIKSGTVVDGVVNYTVYADQSNEKNLEVREALEKGNLQPTIDMLNKLEAEFTANVKKRWPSCQEARLHGVTYKAGEVEGELFDGYKSYSETIDYIFELAGKKRKEEGLITPLGVITPSDGPAIDNDSSDDSDEKKKRTKCEVIAPAATEVPAVAENNSNNPHTQSTSMPQIEALEKILGEGTVQVDASGVVQLTSEQIATLSGSLAKADAAQNLVTTQQNTIAALQLQTKKDADAIKELAELTGKPIEQTPPQNDNSTTGAAAPLDGPISSGRLDNYKKDASKLHEVMTSLGFIQ